MSNALMGITGDLVTLALDAASTRQQAIAHNIANASTPGFVPYQTSFEGQLDQLQTKIRNGVKPSQTDLMAFKSRTMPMEVEPGVVPKVALDMEAAKLAETVLQYQAVTRAYNQMSSLLSMAINDGRK